VATFSLFTQPLSASSVGQRVAVADAPTPSASKPKINYPAPGQVTGQISDQNVANIVGTFQAGKYVIYAIDLPVLPVKLN